MGHKIARMLYGSQNYNLNTPESDEDFKIIEFPDAEDLLYCKTLNRELSEHKSVWDVRNFFKYLLKANSNALELLFSTKQEYFDEDFTALLDYVRPRVGSIIRLHWIDFSKATYGLAWQNIKRNKITPKTVARLIYFWQLWQSLDCGGSNGEMTVETWRLHASTLPREVRAISPEEQEKLEQHVNFVGRNWFSPQATINIQPLDEEIYSDLKSKFLAYFKNHLTSC